MRGKVTFEGKKITREIKKTLKPNSTEARKMSGKRIVQVDILEEILSNVVP